MSSVTFRSERLYLEFDLGEVCQKHQKGSDIWLNMIAYYYKSILYYLRRLHRSEQNLALLEFKNFVFISKNKDLTEITWSTQK